MLSLKRNSRKRPPMVLFSVLFIALLLSLLIFAADHIGNANSTEQLEILTQSVSRSVTACYALEGVYPPNLDYLVKHYGLSYDTDQYFIDYQYIGSNLRPDITIIKKDTSTWYD